ncbi:hypothetical protein CR513_09107, partial [Mucuna pruriens]
MSGARLFYSEKEKMITWVRSNSDPRGAPRKRCLVPPPRETSTQFGSSVQESQLSHYSGSEASEGFPFKIWYRDNSNDDPSKESFSWVDSEVVKISSVLIHSSSLLGMTNVICQRRPWSVKVSPCSGGESVNRRPTDREGPFFYLYETLPLKLGVKLPFTHFERSVLRALNVAPTQLHPNGWAFVRVFELLCEDMGRVPSLGVFFWFFSVRRNHFFRVAPGDARLNLLMDNSKEPFFPLYWTQQPVVSASVNWDDLEEWETKFVKELGDMPILSSYFAQALRSLEKKGSQLTNFSDAGSAALMAPLSAAPP